jgi:multidrug efflux system membrane fusion protein
MMRPKRIMFFVVLVAGAGALGYWGVFGRKMPAALATPAVPVLAAPATTRDFPIWLSAVGTVQSPNVVNVRARVEGELQKLAFAEGQEVRAGQLLAQIDPRPLQAQLNQALANLRKDEAQLAHARAELGRYIELSQKGFVAPTNVEALRVQAASLEATTAADRAAVETASLQLGFTTITAPIDGRVGMRQVDPGSMVRASDPNGIVTLTQVRPVAVLFSLPQDALQEIRARRAQGKLAAIAQSRDGTQDLARGELTVIDSQVDPATGQIKMKAVFANDDGALWPGEFVVARLLVRTELAATGVPARAIVSGREGPYVYVVKADRTVEARSVAPGASADGFTQIRTGIAAGEVVVLDGQSRLAPGMKVEVKSP